MISRFIVSQAQHDCKRAIWASDRARQMSGKDVFFLDPKEVIGA